MSINGNIKQADGVVASSSVSHPSPTREPMGGAMRGKPQSAQGWVKGLQLLLTFLALVLLAKICWTLFAPLPVPSNAPAITPDKSSQVENNADQIVSIKEANPFAISGADFIDIVQNDQPVIPEVKETALNLKLHGVRFDHQAGDNKAGSAIIDVGGADGQAVFKVGDTITQGVVLSELLEGEVIITRGGVKESLQLEGNKDGSNQGGRQNNRRDGLSVTSSLPNIRSGVNSSAIVGAKESGASDANNELSGNGVKNINIRDVLRVRRRRNEQGQFALFLQPGKNREAFAEAGLVANDMLVNVNGTPPPENLRALYDMINRFSAGGTISMIVERDGIPQQITINPSDLVQSPTLRDGDEG